MRDLIERLENATEPSRDLDGQIYQTVDPVIAKCWPHWDRAQRENLTPRYTKSIDEALTLLEDGVEYSITTLYHVALVEVGLNVDDGLRTVRRVDMNVPLAICAAALQMKL